MFYDRSQVSVIDLSQTFSLQSLWVSRGLDPGFWGDTTKLLTSCLKPCFLLLFHLSISILCYNKSEACFLGIHSPSLEIFLYLDTSSYIYSFLYYYYFLVTSPLVTSYHTKNKIQSLLLQPKKSCVFLFWFGLFVNTWKSFYHLSPLIDYNLHKNWDIHYPIPSPKLVLVS